MNENNSPNEKLIGVEVSGTSLKAVYLDENNALVDSAKYKINNDSELFTQLVNFLNNLQKQFGGFTKIGLAVPGLLEHKTHRVAISTHLPEQTKIDLVSEIKIKTGVDVFLENDANAAAFGEYVLGAGRGSRDMFYVTLGKGVGGAFIINGNLFRGAAGFAGEIGYVTVDADGTKLEEVASAGNFIDRVRMRVNQDNTSSLANIDEEEMSVKHVVRAAMEGDDFSRMMLERTGNYIGKAIANVINLLNIEKIVIGGAITEVETIVVDAIADRAKEQSFEPSFAATQIVAGELGGQAAAIGVALLAAKSEIN